MTNETETIEIFKSLTVGQLLDISEELVDFGPWMARVVIALGLAICEAYRDEGEPYGGGADGLVRWIEERRAVREITQKLRDDPEALALLAPGLNKDDQ